jgi:hypothetical protein
MMAETLARENHCFSFSANTKYTHPSNPKTEIVILPEMVSQAPRTHHKVEIHNKMDDIHGKQDKPFI